MTTDLTHMKEPGCRVTRTDYQAKDTASAKILRLAKESNGNEENVMK